MRDPLLVVIFLPGAGGGVPDLTLFKADRDDTTRFEAVVYPGWSRYVEDGFSAEVLVKELADEIEKKIPHGPIRIVGMSIGGHFGYAAATRLQASGREIAGFCAIDTFMIASAAPSTGWMGRAMTQGFDMLRERRISDLGRFVRSLFWRALFRLARGRLPGLLRGFSSSGRLPSFSKVDPLFEKELSMRLLIRETAPWIASLDRDPVPLNAPAVLIRSRLTAVDDAAWRRRCPNIEICEIPGTHQTLSDPGNIGLLREAFINATRDWR
jgi:pimeloyl-ACP methyl ester carboxylesterase